MRLDIDFINSALCDSIEVKVLDSVNAGRINIEADYEESIDELQVDADNVVLPLTHPGEYVSGSIRFYPAGTDSSPADVVVFEVRYKKDGRIIGSNVLQDVGTLKLLKYKVEMPRGAKVTLFDDETLEAQFVAWELPCPNTLPNMTFLQVKAANGFEKQITPSAGSYSVEVWTELGRRYAVFGEIWTYSFAQTLWFADLKVQLSNYDWVDVVPTAGEGGTIVTALPQ